MNHVFKPKVVPIPAQECLSAKLINLSEKLITNKKAPNIWNSLPNSLKTTKDLNT